MKYTPYLPIIILAAASANVFSLDNPHFYRATNMLFETRLEHDYLTTFNATLAGGSTNKGRSCDNTIVPLFDIYGAQAFQPLALNTPFANSDSPFNQLLEELAALPTRPGFATVSTNGHFNIIEANLSLAQNLRHGLFLFYHLPVRKLKINSISFTDLSPDDTIFPNKNTPAWQSVFKNISPLLAYYQFNDQPTSSTGVGDLSSWLGWTHNYQDTKTIDFIDFTLMSGILFPTGKEKNEHQLFSLPTGYNGHWGFPLSLQASLGFYEWVTIGAYVNTLFFLNKNRIMHIKTDAAQSGIIKLASADVSDHRGSLTHTGLYLKADHVGHNVSVTAAYSFAIQQKSNLKPYNSDFSVPIINSDPMLNGWKMHTLNFLAEYDFARDGKRVGNRVGLFYNLQVAGSRVFDTNVVGGSYGIDISWYI
jgi:hypothetical protein